MENRIDLAIIGGGLFGASTLHFARQRKLNCMLFEKTHSLGGKIQSKSTHFPIELGPNTVQYTEGTFQELVQEFQLEENLILGNSASKSRLVYQNGQLKALPSSPPSLLQNKILSFPEKLSFIFSLFKSAKGLEKHSNLHTWVSQHFNPKTADYFLDAFVKGIYATDSKELNFLATFPELHSCLQQEKSVLKGLKAFGASRPKTIGIAAMKGGWQKLTEAIAERYPEYIQFDSEITQILKHNDGWVIQHNNSEVLASNIVISTPAHAVENMHISNVEFPHFEYSDIQLMHWTAEDIEHFPNAYGVLFHEASSVVDTYGILFNGKIFPDYQPNQFTTFCPLNTTEAIMRSRIQSLFPDTKKLKLELTSIWKQGIPKPTEDYLVGRSTVTSIEQNNPGLYFKGDYMGNLAVGQRIQAAKDFVSQHFA